MGSGCHSVIIKKEKVIFFQMKPQTVLIDATCSTESKAGMTAAVVSGSLASGEGQCKQQHILSSVSIPLNIGSWVSPA